jgi:hypothetical protein
VIARFIKKQQVIETAAAIVQEDQVIEYARGRSCSRIETRFLIAPFIIVIRLAEGIEVGAVAIESGAVVGDVLFEIWHPWIWIANVCRNA